MSTPKQFDFGFESRTTNWQNARVVLMFVAPGTESDFGLAKGPLAVADASRYAEYYEMEGNFSPFEIGVCSEILDEEDLEARIDETKQSGKFPIVIADCSSIVDLSVDISVVQRGMNWYEFIDELESRFLAGVDSAKLKFVGQIEPSGPKALLCAQVLIKMVGFIYKARR